MPGTPHTDLSPELLAHMQAIKKNAIEYGLNFLDACLSIENLIDPHSPFVMREEQRQSQAPGESVRKIGEPYDATEPEDPAAFHAQRLPAKDYMDPFINPQGAIDKQRKEHDEK